LSTGAGVRRKSGWKEERGVIPARILDPDRGEGVVSTRILDPDRGEGVVSTRILDPDRGEGVVSTRILDPDRGEGVVSTRILDPENSGAWSPDEIRLAERRYRRGPSYPGREALPEGAVAGTCRALGSAAAEGAGAVEALGVGIATTTGPLAEGALDAASSALEGREGVIAVTSTPRDRSPK
jgi:hypothetical protein